MNGVFEINFAIFSLFIALYVTEIMGSVLLLLFWKATRAAVLPYVIPVWELTGTFGALWVVTADFAYPSLLLPAAALFAPVAVVGLIVFVIRNSSISYAEFILKRGWLDEEKLYKAYALATVVVGLAVLMALSALFSGAGVDLAAGSFSFLGWVSAPGSLLFLLGTVLIAVGAAPIFYGVTTFRTIVLPGVIAGMGVSILAYYLYSPSLVPGWMLAPVLLTLLAGLLFVLSDTTARIVSHKVVFLTVLSLIVFSLQFVAYPTLADGAIPIDSVTTSGPMASAYVVITAIGALLIAAMIAFLLIMARRPVRGTREGIAGGRSA